MSVSLTLDEVKQRARRAPMVPIFRDMLSDALTPVTAYAALDALEQVGWTVARQCGIGRHRGERVRQHVPEDRDHRRPPGALLDLVER